MKSSICITNRKQTASFSIVGLMLAIAPLWLMLAAANTSLWLMLAAANTSVHAQTTSSPADWTRFLRDNMQRYNPYETVLSVNNVSGLKLKWAFNGEIFASSPAAVANGVVYIVGEVDPVTAILMTSKVDLSDRIKLASGNRLGKADQSGPSNSKGIAISVCLSHEETAPRIRLQILGMHSHIAYQKERPARRVECEGHKRSKGKSRMLAGERRQGANRS